MIRRIKEKSRGETGKTAAGCKRQLHNEFYLDDEMPTTLQGSKLPRQFSDNATFCPPPRSANSATPPTEGCWPAGADMDNTSGVTLPNA